MILIILKSGGPGAKDLLKERAHYLSTTKDVGNRRLDFRFAH
jgi:hypothetical protein